MEISLKRDGWHRNLQIQIFGNAQFENFCPYFWLTIFCLVISPFFFTFKGVKWCFEHLLEGCAYLFGGMFAALDTNVCLPLERYFLQSTSDEQLSKLYFSSADFHAQDGEGLDRGLRRLLYNYHSERAEKRAKALNRKFQVWKETISANGDDWKKILEAARERAHVRREERMAEDIARKKYEADKAQRRKDLQIKIANSTKAAAPYVLTVLAAIVLSFVGLLLWKLAHLAAAVNWAPIFHAIGKALVVILCAIVILVPIALLIHRLILFVKKCDLDLPGAKMAAPFVAAGRGVVWLGKAIALPFMAVGGFVIQYIKVAKSDYCPKIKWD